MEKSEEVLPKDVVIEDKIQKFRLHFLVTIGEYVQLLIDTFKATLWRPPKFRVILKQMYNIGVGSLGVVAITGLFTGLVLAAQSFYQLSSRGLSGVTGLMVSKAMITELGPILTAFMVTGRVGAAMCAELGTMRVTEQIDALRSMAVNPNRFLVAPRLISGMLMMPLLTLFSMVMGVFGGYLISVYFFHMSPNAYLLPIPKSVTYFDLFNGFTKAFIFGILIMTISCFKGMNTSGGAEGVGKTTTSSVVICYIAILFSNFFLTMALNSLYKEIMRMLS
ncbi:MAG: ABC transporter permease [Simkaniaceae bacterium]|nr:ABC transporter permease [Candidatus Sacchlamyda saccharinae]